MHDKFTAELLKVERSSMYHFFSYILLNELSGGDLLHLRENVSRLSVDTGGRNEDLSLIANFLSDHEIDETLLNELAADYASLFLGLRRNSPHPYGSVYLNKARIVMDEESEKVAEIYSTCGLELVDSICEPCDHIGLELGFMAHTSRRVEESVNEKTKSEVLQTIQLQYNFLNKHINSWFKDFLKDVKQTEIKYPFYPSLLQLLGEILQHEEMKSAEVLKNYGELPVETLS